MRRSAQQSGFHIYQFLNCSLCTGKCLPLFQEDNTVTSVTLLTSSSNWICKHPAMWVAERVCFIRSYSSKVLCWFFFFFIESKENVRLFSMKVFRDHQNFEFVACNASYRKGKKKNRVAFHEPDVNCTVIIITLVNCKQLNQREEKGRQTGNEARVKIIR